VLYNQKRHKTNKMEYIFIFLLAFTLITKAQNLYDKQILKENAMAQQTSSNIFDPTNTYAFNFPLPQDFRISIFIDPCRFNVYNCCVNVFGEEYMDVCIFIYKLYIYIYIYAHIYIYCIDSCRFND
jgi:hypothetical protein